MPLSDSSRPFRRWAPWPLILLACIAVPFLTPVVPFTRGIEQVAHDAARYLLAKRQPNDPGILLLLYTDAVARDTGRTNPVDRAMLAKAVRATEAAGAKAIGIDMVFTQETPDQSALIEALRGARIPVFLAFADPERDKAVYWDATVDNEARQYQDWFWRQLASRRVSKASPVVGSDDSGIARQWPEIASDGNPPLALAVAGRDGAYRAYRGGIAYTRMTAEAAAESGQEAARGMFPALDVNLLADPAFASAFSDLVRGRYVLIGADTFNSDQFVTPITRLSNAPTVPGVVVHAQMLRQALDGRFPAPLNPWVLAVIALALALFGSATSTIERKPLILVTAILVQLGVLASLPLIVDRAGYDILSLPLFGLLLTWLLAFLTVGYALRSRTSAERAFARGALGKFLPEAVAREILEHPKILSLEGEERNLFILFTDIEGFTRYSHGRDPQEVARLLNRYLDGMSSIVLAHSGTLDKFIGDAIVAFWGAPIASEADASNAVACALELQDASDRFRREAGQAGDTFGRTRIGLHFGRAVVGNFGGSSRIQYTALGDAMNTAARLEGANKYLESDILVSAAVANRAPLFTYRPLGWIALSGVDTPIEVFEPVSGERAAYAAELADAMTAADVSEALRVLADRYPGDRALKALAMRGDRLTREHPYVLDTK